MRATHYDRLGVSPHASQEEIRRAYHRQARRHHPDAHPEVSPEPVPPPGRRSTMADINAAWEVLGDPEKRQAYDRAIGTTPRPRPPGAGGFGPPGTEADNEEYDDLRHLYDDLVVPRRARPSDLLIMVPVVLLVIAVALFAFSTMSESEGLRNVALLMAPVTAASFVAAPLVTMLRARDRDARGQDRSEP